MFHGKKPCFGIVEFLSSTTGSFKAKIMLRNPLIAMSLAKAFFFFALSLLMAQANKKNYIVLLLSVL